VKKPTGSVSHIATPIRAWIHRSAFLLLVAGAFALMLLGKADTILVERLRAAVADAVTPLLDIASRPIGTINDLAAEVRALADLRAENEALRRETERLRTWQAVAHRLEAENAALRTLTRQVPDPGLRFVTARVVGDPGGAFARSVLVNAGTRDGVVKAQAAITGDGLAGRVAEVGVRSARVLLLSDINSRVPVFVGAARDRAILAGDNSSQPRLLYLAPGITIKPNDLVVTSGHGGIFPPDLPVGVVSEVADGTLRVRPYVDWAHMEYLRLADYELPGELQTADEARAGAAGVAADAASGASEASVARRARR